MQPRADDNKQKPTKRYQHDMKFLSDHTEQSATLAFFTKEQEPILTLHGSTWNLLNKCFSTHSGNSYSNNPWNKDEPIKKYICRKEKQIAVIKKILGIISDDPSLTKNTRRDFMFLQEIDFISEDYILHNGLSLRTLLEQELQTHGFNIVYSTNIFNCQPLAIIYNQDTLQFDDQITPRGILPNNKNKLKGFACQFIHIESGHRVELINLHLDYTEDYTASIAQLQKQAIKDNLLTVMGGDTNHIPNVGITGFVNHEDNVTNIISLLEGDQLKFCFTMKVHDSKTGEKATKGRCLDGFLASPTKQTYVQLTLLPSHLFTLRKSGINADGEPKLQYAQLIPMRHLNTWQYTSDVGKRLLYPGRLFQPADATLQGSCSALPMRATAQPFIPKASTTPPASTSMLNEGNTSPSHCDCILNPLAPAFHPRTPSPR